MSVASTGGQQVEGGEGRRSPQDAGGGTAGSVFLEKVIVDVDRNATRSV